jgi:phosphoribosylformimino-5-aminoimidazole carboxamide ribotide isomerase
MQIIPTIELMDGKAVRVAKGDRSQVEVYSDEPWTLVKSFVEDGAERIHVVDVDGAFAGSQEHRAVVRRIMAKSAVPIQVGGGIRERKALELVFNNGAKFAVVGTAAVNQPDFVATACADFPGRIVVAIDSDNGNVATDGREQNTSVSTLDLAKQASDWGAAAILYTDINRAGADSGPNIQETTAMVKSCGVPVIAAGGVSSVGDIKALRECGVAMVIVGRSLYEKRFTLVEAIEAAAG